jgi:hypothetical protein
MARILVDTVLIRAVEGYLFLMAFVLFYLVLVHCALASAFTRFDATLIALVAILVSAGICLHVTSTAGFHPYLQALLGRWMAILTPRMVAGTRAASAGSAHSDAGDAGSASDRDKEDITGPFIGPREQTHGEEVERRQASREEARRRGSWTVS